MVDHTYHLEFTLAAATADAVTLRAALRHHRSAEATGDAAAVASRLVVPKALLARCGALQRWPDQVPGLMAESPAGAPATELRAADPTRVDRDLATAAPDDLAAWLWQRLPMPIQAELSALFAHNLRLFVHAPPEAAVLPWHRLGAWHRRAAHQPGITGRWDICMFVAGGPVPAVAIEPRALLLVGSQKMRPEQTAAEHRLLDVVAALRGAAIHCDVAASRPALQGFDQQLGVWHQLRSTGSVLEVLEAGRYDLVHFIGHSDATPRADQDPFGATALMIETPNGTFPLQLAELSVSLRRAQTKLVVLHACMTRERVAAALLGPGPQGEPGAVAAVVSMGAMAPLPVCAAFASAFYPKLAAATWLADATFAARQEVARAHPGYDWLPLTWTRSVEPLRLMAAPRRAVESYCRKLQDAHRTFEGAFDDLDGAFEHVAIDLYVAPGGPRSAPGAARPQRVLREPPPGGSLHFQDLLDSGGWWTLGGGPGSGKTTTLRQAARRLAADRTRARVPVYLPMASWLAAVGDAGGPAVWFGTYLESEYGEPGLGAELLRLGGQGDLVILLDGFDELDPEQRTRVTKQGGLLTQMHTAFQTCRLVVATRRYESSRGLPSAWFADADLRPLEPADAVDLLRRVLAQHLEQKAVDEHTARFGENIETGPRLWREIARTPLLVSLLALQLRAGSQPARSRLAFFACTFALLCGGLHRDPKHRNPIPYADDALRVLRFLAWRLTVAKRRFATAAELVAWLQPRGGVDAALAPPPDVVAALGDVAKWELPRDAPERARRCLSGQAASAASEFLGRVATHTLIAGPDDTSVGARWRFWHKSFQEALCAEYLHERCVAPAPSEAQGVAALLQALDGWIGADGGKQADAALVARHRAEIEPQWREDERTSVPYTEFQRGVHSEAWSCPVDKPHERNARLNAADKRRDGSYADAVLDLAAQARALAEAQEPFLEALALLTDRLTEPEHLVRGLLARNWQLAKGAALSAAEPPLPCLAELLAELPELLHRVAVLERLAECGTAGAPLLDALVARARLLAPAFVPNAEVGARAAWDAPGELHALLLAARGVAARASLPAQPFEAGILACAPTPKLADLTAHLALVPGRASHAESGRRALGVRLWRPIAPGEFWMGSPGARGIGDEVRHRVRIQEGFWIGAVTVTVGLYRLFSPNHVVRTRAGDRSVRDVEPATAVGCVSHHAARMFCAWLEHHAGAWLRERLAADAGPSVPERLHVRLPREAEWEYAARAGSEPDYCFGDSQAALREWAWFGDADDAPHEVATKSGGSLDAAAPAPGANRWGLFDVHGNVWEWCADWYGAYPKQREGEVREDLRGAPSGRFRVLRGGSYGNDADDCRSAFRSGDVPDGDGNDNGFRVVLSASPELGP